MMQLKQKYQAMRKMMTNNIEHLRQKKKELTANNVSLKSKYETLKGLEKESFDKLMHLDQSSQAKIITIDNDYNIRSKERLELEANNRLLNVDLTNERAQNQELEYILKAQQDSELMRQKEFEKEILLIENMINEKIKKFEDIEIRKVNVFLIQQEIEAKLKDDPNIVKEAYNNEQYKLKKSQLEVDIIDLNNTLEQMEMINDFLVKKKEYVISERKRIIQVNEELKREIEAQNQLYNIRIQKKLKENTSLEYRKMEEHLLNINNKISELEVKIDHEMDKIKSLKREIIKLNIELRNKNEIRDQLVESVDVKIKEITDCRLYLEELAKTNLSLKEKVKVNNLDFHRKRG